MLQAEIKASAREADGTAQNAAETFKTMVVAWVCHLGAPLHRAVHKHVDKEAILHVVTKACTVQAKSAPAANEALQDLLWMPDVADFSRMLLEPGSLHLLLDLNDANQTFEMLHGHTINELRHAPATIVPAKPKVRTFSHLSAVGGFNPGVTSEYTEC